MIQAIVFLYMSCLWCHVMLKLYGDQTQRLSVGLCMSACQHSRSIGPQLRQWTTCGSSGDYVCAGWVAVVMPAI